MWLESITAYQIIGAFIPLALFIVFFLLAFFAYFWKREWLSKTLWWGIGIFALIHVVRALYVAWLQFIAWQNDPFSQFLLPPHEPIAYFWQYAWTHYLVVLPWVLGGAAALGAILLVIGILSKGRMVDETDAKLAVFGALIVGWPSMIAFFLVSLVALLVVSLLYGIIYKQSRMIPLTPFFFFGILTVFFWGETLMRLLGLGQLVL